MNREIKFRAWLAFSDDQKNHREINGDPYRNGFYIHTKYEIFKRAAGFIANEDLINQVEIQNKSENLIWEQFTGLKDKNCVEIYEGDIINFWDGMLIDDKNGELQYEQFPNQRFSKSPNVIREVTYVAPSFRASNAGPRLGDRYLKSSDIEVIGNIHENPELLGDV